MISQLKLNQGSNSYKCSSPNKIENSYRPSGQLSDMSSSSRHTNMSFSDEEGSLYGEDYDSVYSNTIIETTDRLNDFNYSSDEEYPEPDDTIQAELELEAKMEVEDAEIKTRAERMSIQDPTKMTFVRPLRDLPSDEEMYSEWMSFLASQERSERRANAASIISNWWFNNRYRLVEKSKRNADMRNMERVRELIAWNKNRNLTSRIIKKLEPIVSNDIEYKKMCAEKTEAADDERLKRVEAHRKAIAVSAAIKESKRKKKLSLEKKGLNKKSLWHTERASGSLAVKKNIVRVSEAGQGDRAQRKIRQEKQRAQRAQLALCPSEQKTDIPVGSPIEDTDEEKSSRLEEAEDLARISRLIIEKTEKKSVEEKIASDLKTEEEKEITENKANEEEFIAIMSKNNKNMLKTVVVKVKKASKSASKSAFKPNELLCFKSLKDGVIERRMETDEKFAARTKGYAEMANNDTLQRDLTRTSMCRSVTEKKKCYHPNCRFAHSVEELQERKCKFREGCCFVEKMENGQYRNVKFGNTGKKCSCMHPGEDKRGFCLRMGVEYKETVSSTASPASPPVVPIVPAVSVSNNSMLQMLQSETTEKSTSVWPQISVVEGKTSCVNSNMTNKWVQVVVDALTPEEKLKIYGKGATILGKVEDKHNNLPITPSIIRLSNDKRGFGFEENPTVTVKSIVKSTVQVKTVVKTVQVTVPGFSWVKGEVLQPVQQAIQISSPIIYDPMVKVRAAVLVINNRIADYERKKSIAIADRVELAKAKAIEINTRLQKVIDRKDGWKKVEGNGQTKIGKSKETEEKPTVIRVTKENAEIALLGAIRSGLTNFKIEYIDQYPTPPTPSKYELDEEDESSGQEDNCDCGDCPDCSVPRPHMIRTWGYKQSMIRSR